MWTPDSLGKTLMLGTIESRRRGWPRMRWLDGITNSMNINLGKFWEMVRDRGCCRPWGSEEQDTASVQAVQFSRSIMFNSLRPHGLQHARPPCPSPTPRVFSDSCPLSQWHHPTISPSVIPFSCHLQSFPASGSFPKSQFFTSGGQSIGASASASVLLKCCCWLMKRHWDSWPPEEKNSILGQRRGLITQSFCAIEFY